MSVLSGPLTGIHPELPFLTLSLGLCVFLALLVFFAWQVNFRSGSKFPKPVLRLATLFLSFQILLIVINIVMAQTGTDLFPRNLWHLDLETSIPSINSTVQLFLLSSLCFLTGFATGKASWTERVYWFGLGLGLATMTLFEFDVISKYIVSRKWVAPFVVILGATSLFMFLRKNYDDRRLFLLLLLGGLAMWAYGVLNLDYVYIDGINVAPLEETLESLGIIVALASVTGYATRIVPVTLNRRKMLLINLCLTSAVMVILLLGSLVWEDREYVEIRFLGKHFGRSITVDVDDGALALRGWSTGSLSAGTIPRVHLWLHTTRLLNNDIGFTIQLLDQESKAVIEETNKRSDRKADQWESGIRHYFTQKILFALPEDIPTNRALWLLLSFWEIEENGFSLLPIDSNDYPLLSETHIILDEVVFPETVTSASLADAPGRFANGFVLHDVAFPDQARAGGELAIRFTWGAERNGSEDLIQFLHFFHVESGAYQVVDQMPLGLRLPTRLWYAGLQASEAWRFTLPADLQPGRYAIYSGLYRLSDLQRLSVILADGTQPADSRIPLGTILIEG